jgi:hypothetical protein
MFRAREEAAYGITGKYSKMELGDKFVKEHGLSNYFAHTPGGAGAATYGDLQALAASAGITSAHGRAFMEARVTAEGLEEKQTRKLRGGPLGAPSRAIDKGGRYAGDVTESVVRQAAFLKGLRDSGGDVMGARAFTMLRHGDYADLTDFEYGKIRDLLPFYKWTRTNLPLQLHQLFEAPGRLTGVLHAKNAAWDAAGMNYGDEQYKMPPWMREGFSFPFKVPGTDVRTLVTLDLPMNDLYNSTNEYVSQFLPALRPVFESYVIDKTIFANKPLTGKPVHAEWIDVIPGLPSMLSALNIGEIGPDGKYYLDDKMQNVLSTIPIFSRTRDWIYDDPKRQNLRINTIASAVFGMGSRPLDDGTYTSEELNFFYTQVEPTLAYLKGIGYQLPTTDDIQSAYGMTNNALLATGITPGGPAATAA